MDKFKWFCKEVLPYIIAVIVVILIKSYVVAPVMVNGDSMYPTLKNKDIMILNRIGYKDKKFDRFDIVVIKTEKNKIIKRVIGLPGEKVQILDGSVYINGEKLEDDVIEIKMKYAGLANNVIELNNDEYFVLGDNRNDSSDSRFMGPINKKQILGKTRLTIFPFNRIGNK